MNLTVLRVLLIGLFVGSLVTNLGAQDNRSRVVSKESSAQTFAPAEQIPPPLPNTRPEGAKSDLRSGGTRPNAAQPTVSTSLGLVLMPAPANGLRVSEVRRGSVAERAGVTRLDTIVAINGKPVAGVSEIPRDSMRTVTVIRNGSERTLQVPVWNGRPADPERQRDTTPRYYSYRRAPSPTYSRQPVVGPRGYTRYGFSGNTAVGPNMALDIGVEANGYPFYPFLWGYGPGYYYGRPPFYGKNYGGRRGNTAPYDGRRR